MQYLNFFSPSSLDTWAKQNEKGVQCLSRQVLGEPSSDLQDVSDECKCALRLRDKRVINGGEIVKQVLDTMFEEYAAIVDQLGLAETLQSDDGEANIPKEIILLRNCVDMYDQEYMVKVTCKARGMDKTETHVLNRNVYEVSLVEMALLHNNI